MTSIDEIIKREVNPFDLVNLKPGNFWGEQQDAAQTVDSIHQEAITEIEALVDLVAKDHVSRTVLLAGDSGSGKSYLLGRLKRTLNPKAFFAYIGPWADSDHIWRHILRYTVDSLMHNPEGQQDSQLLLWLKSLSAFTKRNLKQRVLNDSVWKLLQSDRKKFIKHLKNTYKSAGIYSPDIFFGILHDLTNPELYDSACEWLRGDDLSEESMQALKVRNCIDTEDAAKNILANFGRISTETQPIVICFDNLETCLFNQNGILNPQPLFNVNTTIHNDYLRNFVIIISVVTDIWKRSSVRIQQADKARLETTIQLKRINLEQAEALWTYRLGSLHHQAKPKPESRIYPLTKQLLEQSFPGTKTDPRNVLILGRQEYRKHKDSIGENLPDPDPEPDSQSEFQLLWQQEYQKTEQKITKIALLSAPELVRMLQEACIALGVKEARPKLLGGKYASYSLSYKHPQEKKQVGIIWTEDSNMTSFYTVMNACQTLVNKRTDHALYLIRAASVGTPKLVGQRIYQQIFTGNPHQHLKPNLPSVHTLATYYSFVNSALAGELVVAGTTTTLEQLQTLVRESKVLEGCALLKELKIMPEGSKPPLAPIKKYLLNLIKNQHFIGRKVLVDNTHGQFSDTDISHIGQLIEQFYRDNIIQIINPHEELDNQLVCWIPEKNIPV
ncbi:MULTISPECIES: ATP-binding protein [Trichocoleus]|uniref:ATP-binding protein n=1 Tax=Trichocoleus desertorum GB2-A4 TaxID=2933944 RepID=A0ABV0JDR5_9CYAN|nr:ATP-binding protein [Trichocoleus sp. FACHB-46]MBD1861325.1 ATP-binding protein [Trichocoleus sp. FACHB-46]